MVLVVFLTKPAIVSGVEFSDDFENGIIDFSLWVYGGEDRSISKPGPDVWSVSEGGGYLRTNVLGPHSGNTTGESV